MKDILNNLIKGTLEGNVKWEISSNPFEFYTFYDKIRYSIIQIMQNDEDLSYQLIKWSVLGDPNEILESSAGEIDGDLYLLYEYVLKKNENINVRFNTYKKMVEESMKNERNLAVSLHKVMQRLGFETSEERPKIRLIESESFYYKKDDSEGKIVNYVQPPMSQLPTAQGMTPYTEAEVILISAPGATGKSAMSVYLSNKLDIPVLNLGKHPAVGANSISGLLMNNVVQEDTFVYHGGLKNGTCSMIIDGLDEAAIHITQDGFNSFLKDVAFFAKGAKGLPFVILGRPAVMEDAALELEVNDVKTTLLQIEPFTIPKAKEFIDNLQGKSYVSKYEKEYKEVRDYIIDQIGGFFKSESELNKNIFERFIGYAPVLQSISTLLSDKLNYHNLLDELKKNKKQKIDLLVDIVNRIVLREQTKIHDEVLEQLFEKGRSQEFKDEVRKKTGTPEEQYQRILGRLVDKDVTFNVSGDSHFDELYNEKMTTWTKNHPFLKGNESRIENIVFESFIIAQLINKDECKEDVLNYLEMTGSCSYLLLDIYSTIHGKNNVSIDYRLFPFLYSSFKALDHPQDMGTTEVESDEDDVNTDNSIRCSLSFGREESEYEYDFLFDMPLAGILRVPSPLSAINIDAPINILMAENKTDIQAPISIKCKNLEIKSKDVLLSTPKAYMGSIVFECENFKAICDDGGVPSINQRTPKENNNLRLITRSQLHFPFNEYRDSASDMNASDKALYEAYQKMRRMILMFRSHSKGVLARFCSKIDARIGKSDLGLSIIEGLKAKGVLYSNGYMYYINIDKFGEVLGAKYDDIRSSVINDKTRAFLESIRQEN